MQAPVTHEYPTPARGQRLARVSGLLYLALAACGMFAPLVLEGLVVPGDAVATAAHIAGSRRLFGGSLVIWIVIVGLDVALAVTLGLLLERAGRVLALLAAALRLVYAGLLAAVLLHLFDAFRLLTSADRGAGLDAGGRERAALAAIERFDDGFLVALVLFGVHLVALGVLLYRARAVPAVFGALLALGGGGYIADSLAALFLAGHGGLPSVILLAPAVAGELGLTGWLLVKGVKVRPAGSGSGAPGARPGVAVGLGAGAIGGRR